jgi:hypothetical protein
MITLAYLVISFVCGIGAMLNFSVITGLIIWGASSLAVVGTGGTILGARSRGAVYTVGSVLFGLALFALTYWLSTKFSIGLFGVKLSGLVWCLIGCAVGVWWGLSGHPEDGG